MAWAFGKVDRRAAYKFLPIRVTDSRFAANALRIGLIPRTPIFGATASVLRCNCLSRVLTTLLVRLLRPPLLGYFGDFGFFTTELIADTALRKLKRFCESLRIPQGDEKSDVAPVATYMGPIGASPAPQNDAPLMVALAPVKDLRREGGPI